MIGCLKFFWDNDRKSGISKLKANFSKLRTWCSKDTIPDLLRNDATESEHINKPEKTNLVSFKDALWQFGKDTDCYYTNGHDQMWEHPAFNNLTQEEYYRHILIIAIENRGLSLYGIKKFSEDKGLQKIATKFLTKEKLETIDSPHYDTIFSVLKEPLYTNIAIRSDELDIVIRQYKNPALDQ